MKQFVYLPLNLHADPKRALLISFGSGSTAKALRDVENLEAIDVVDISRDVLSLSDVVYPEESQNPLADDRVSTHVGDGRFFLLTTNKYYDLITSEPPPPKHAGVGSLYTQEFFKLVKDRLTEGGINTHWLPTHALTYDDTRAITRAYCEVFEDCTLWKGTHLNWMLMGSRNANWKTSEADFRTRFEALSAAREGHVLGVETPEQIGAMFLADHQGLREWTRDVLPFKDSFPKRVVDAPSSDQDRIALREWMRPKDARRRFIESEFIANAWPEDLRERSKDYFRYDGIIDDIFLQKFGSPPSVQVTIELVDAILQDTNFERLPAWLLGSHGDYIAAIERNKALYGKPISQRMRGREALGRRDYTAASKLFRNLPTPTSESVFLDAYATAMRGKNADASAIVSANQSMYPDVPWKWLVTRFDLTVAEGAMTAHGPSVR